MSHPHLNVSSLLLGSHPTSEYSTCSVWVHAYARTYIFVHMFKYLSTFTLWGSDIGLQLSVAVIKMCVYVCVHVCMYRVVFVRDRAWERKRLGKGKEPERDSSKESEWERERQRERAHLRLTTFWKQKKWRSDKVVGGTKEKKNKINSWGFRV